MPNYSKCFIYILCCKDANVEEIYIGSTTNLIKRKHHHKSSCTNPNDSAYNHYKYQFIRDNGGWENWDIIALEEFACMSKMEQTKIERSYVEKLKPALNAYVPAHYQSGDMFDRKEYNKCYNETNKDKRKEYQENNKAHKQQYDKEYQEANKDIIRERKKEYQKKYSECPCCKQLVNLNQRARHNKTQKHINNASASTSTTTPSESSESNTE